MVGSKDCPTLAPGRGADGRGGPRVTRWSHVLHDNGCLRQPGFLFFKTTLAQDDRKCRGLILEPTLQEGSNLGYSSLAEIEDAARTCRKCPLGTNLVFGARLDCINLDRYSAGMDVADSGLSLKYTNQFGPQNRWLNP